MLSTRVIWVILSDICCYLAQLISWIKFSEFYFSGCHLIINGSVLLWLLYLFYMANYVSTTWNYIAKMFPSLTLSLSEPLSLLSSLLSSPAVLFSQLMPLRSPHAETQLRPFRRHEHSFDPQGFFDDNWQLHRITCRIVSRATS